MSIKRALIVDGYWLSLILKGVKPWEMRTAGTNIRERVGLIEKGSGLIYGETDIVDSLPPLSPREYFKHIDKHRITKGDDVAHKWRFPWVLENTVKYDVPVPYEHPQGAVIWVRV